MSLRNVHRPRVRFPVPAGQAYRVRTRPIEPGPTPPEPDPPDPDPDPPPEEPGVFGMYIRTAITGPTNTMVNGATDTWAAETSTQPSTSWFLVGANAHKFKDALAARGMNVANDWREEPSPSFPGYNRCLVRGPSVKHFLSMFRQTDLIHGCPPQFIQAIKAVSRVNTKVGFWFHSERIFPGTLYGGWAEYIRQRMLPYIMVGTFGKNWGGSCTADFSVDPEQTNPWLYLGAPAIARCPANPSPSPADTTGHAWQMDFRNPAYPAAIAQAYVDMHNSYWAHGAAQPDTMMSDNCGKSYFPGLATNAPAVDNGDWGAGFEATILAINNALTPLGYETFWGNVGDPTGSAVHTNLKGHFWEHSFTRAALADSITDVLDGLTTLAGKGPEYKCAISYRQGIYPAVNEVMFQVSGQAEWTTILNHARNLNMEDRVYVGVFAEGSDGPLMWQPGIMEEPA